MSAAPPDVQRGTTRRSRWTTPVLVANLVAQVVIVVTGGAVRLTGSGLGCSTWPQCEPGQFTPVRHEATSFHPYIEFGNRTLTGVLTVLAVAALWVVWRQHPRRRTGLRVLALVPLVGVLAQAVVGGLTVLVDLHPAWVGSHFLISMVLIAASAALVRREQDPDDGVVRWAGPPSVRVVTLGVVALGAVVLALGTVVTGAGPHSGDDDSPYRWAVDPLLVTRLHSGATWAFGLALVALLVALRRADEEDLRPGLRSWAGVLAVTLAQGLLGHVQHALGLPEVLVGLHMLGASLLVVALTRLVLALRPRVGTPASPARPAPSSALAA